MKIHEAAKLLNVSLETLRRWEKAGKLIPERTGGNQRVYTEEQIKEFKSRKTSDQLSVISYQKETFANNRSPITNNPSPITITPKHNPVTNIPAGVMNNQSPITNNSSQITKFSVRPFHLIFIGFAVGLLVFFGNKRLNTDVLSYRTDGDVLASLNIRQLPPLDAGSVLGFTTDEDISMRVNVPAIFGQPVIFDQNITAPNVLYTAVAGTGVTITGDPQNPVINADTESIVEDLDIFKTVKVGSDTFDASGITDILTFAASGNTTIAIDKTNKKITYSSSTPDLSAAGGWTDGGTSIYATTTTDIVGIGTTTPSTTLDVTGTFNVTGAVTLGSTVDITGALTLTGNALNTPGDLTITATGGDVILSDGTVINIGGSGSDVAFNVIGDSTSGASASVNSDDDLYIEGNLEVDGTIVGSLSGGVTTSLDPGSVVFIGSASELAADSTNFFFDNSSDELGIGTNSPSYNLHVTGTAGVLGDVTFGNADTDNITITSEFLSSLIPNTNNTYDLGSNTKRWATVYGVTANFTNLSSGSTDISGTTSQDFTINTDNASVDTEDNTLTFDRGTSVVNTEIRWDSSPNYWLSTNAPTFFINGSSDITYSGKAALMVNQIQSQDLITASASGTTKFTVANDGSITTSGTTFTASSMTAFNCSDCIDFDDMEDTLDLDAALTLNQGSNTWSQTFTGTTTNGYNYTADSLTTGTGINYSFDGLTTGKGVYLESTSTAFSSGQLMSLYWNPGSATTATGDILRLDVGSNGIVGNILNVMNGGSSVFSVGQAQITAALPTQFTAAGDVNMAYDLIFSNQTASYIKSYAPLYIEAGETFENNDLTLRAYGTGAVVVDAMSLNVTQAASVSGRLLLGTATNPDNLGQLYATNNIVYGKALAIFNQTESQDIFTASSSGTTRFTIMNTGLTGVGTSTPSALLTVNSGTVATYGKAALIVDHDENQDLITASSSGLSRFIVRSSGDVVIGPTGTFDNAGSNEDLYVRGNLEVDGTIYGTVSATDVTCTDCMDFTELEDTLDLDASLTLNQGSSTWSQTYTGTTTTGYNYTADSLTTATGINYSFDGLTTGKGVYLESTSTAFSTGQLMSLYWNPGSATTATGDILRLDVGSNGIIGNILNVMNGGSTVFSVGQAQITAALPTQFTAAGDVSIAYDLQFTNQTASYIKSLAPLIIETGESFENNNLTLKTYGTGNVLIDSMALNVSQAASISGRLLVGTQTNPDNLGQMYVTNNITYGKALAIFNQTESQDIFTASSSGTTRFSIASGGNVSIGPDKSPDYLLEINSATSADPTFAMTDGDVAHGVTTLADTDAILHFGPISSTVGGVRMSAFADADGQALEIRAVQTAPTDTTPAIKLVGAKASGTGVVDLDAAETVFQVANNDDTAALTIQGSGEVGIGLVAPTKALEVYSASAEQALFDGWFDSGASANNGQILIGSNASFQGKIGYDGASTADFFIDNTYNNNQGDIVFRTKTAGTDIEGLVISGDGKVTIGTGTAGTTSDRAEGSLHVTKSAAPTTITGDDSYISVGGSEFGANSYRIISFGYQYAASGTYSPAYMGYQEISTAGSTNGDLIFGTREGTSDVQATERIRILSTGLVGIGDTAPLGLLEVSSASTTTYGKALAIFNHDEAQELITASASGVTEFAIGSDGKMYIGDNTTLGTSTALCWESKTLNGATVYQVGDCTGTPADYAEQYPVEQGVTYGDIVSVGTQDVLQKDGLKVKRLVKSSQAYDAAAIGVVSNNYHDFTSAGSASLEASDNPMPVALSGRVPVKVASISESIHAGDFVTTSSEAGKAMKATGSGYVIGKALEDWQPGKETVMVYVNNTFHLGSLVESTKAASVDLLALQQQVSDQQLVLETIISGDASVSGQMVDTFTTVNTETLSALNAEVIDTLLSKGQLVVEGTATFKGESIFEKLATFMQNVLFRGIVSFEKPPIFARDTAGRAIITKYTDRVDVVFDEAYLEAPIVTMSLTDTATGSAEATSSAFLSDGLQAVVKNVTATGFSITLPSAAIRDFTFNWIALAVKDVKETKSVSILDSLLDGQVAGEATDSASIATDSGTLESTPSATATGSGSFQ